MHQASEKDFKIARRWQMHRGLPCVIGESGSAPQIVKLKTVPGLGFFRWWWCSPCFFNFYFFFVFYISYIYNHECPWNAYEDARIIKIYYLRSWIQFSFTVLQETRVFGVNSEVHRAGFIRRLGFWGLGIKHCPNHAKLYQRLLNIILSLSKKFSDFWSY
jgi:hypothetical protein